MAWWLDFLFGSRRRADTGEEPKGPKGAPRADEPASYYASEYGTILSQGHTRPTPSFGAPALVWHVGIWPRRCTRPDANGKVRDCDPQDTQGLTYSAAQTVYRMRRQAWIEEINGFLGDLQGKRQPRLGGAPVPAPKVFDAEVLIDPGINAEVEAVSAPSMRPSPVGAFGRSSANAPDSLGFTIWWRDRDEADPVAQAANAIRVRVQVELQADYATVSFVIDAGKQADGSVAYTAADAEGHRRRRILVAVEDVKTICERQMQPATGLPAIDLPALPEHLGPGDSDKLGAACNTLYVEMWEKLRKELGAGLEQIVGLRSDVFANFRGLVMETGGSPDPGLPPARASALGSAPFPVFDGDPRGSGEANAVVKAFWPFVTRVSPRADYREFTASGVLNWRAIYITALGARSQYDEGEEADVAAGGSDEEGPIAFSSEGQDYIDSMAMPKASGGYDHQVSHPHQMSAASKADRPHRGAHQRARNVAPVRAQGLVGNQRCRSQDPHARAGAGSGHPRLEQEEEKHRGPQDAEASRLGEQGRPRGFQDRRW